MIKVLLVEANGSWVMHSKGLLDLELVTPPLGLMSLATYVKQKLKDDCSVRIVNLIVDCPREGDFEVVLRKVRPDVVGIRASSIFAGIFHRTAEQVKAFDSRITVVAGGPYATNDMETALQDINLDYCVIGEGEVTFTELLRCFKNKRSPRDIAGLAYLSAGKILRTPPRPFIKDLDCLPFPDYSLIDLDKYRKFMGYAYSRRRQANLFPSRGCPYRCIYCHGMFGRKVRARSPENVLEELKLLYRKFSIRDFCFYDDNFNYYYRRTMKLLDLIIRSRMKINIYLTASVRSDLVDFAMIDRMVEAGVIFVDYNIETASPRLQKYIRKYLDITKAAENIHYTCDKDIMVGSFIMVGFPTETRQEAFATVDFMKQFKKLVSPQIAAVKYYPHTEIFELARQQGIRVKDIRSTYSCGYHDVSFKETPLISHKDFRDISLRFYSEIVMSEDRILNALRIQKKYLTEREILDCYSLYSRRRINNIEKDILRYAR